MPISSITSITSGSMGRRCSTGGRLPALVIGMALGLSGAYTAASGGERDSLKAVALTLVHFQNHARVLSSVALSAGVLMLGLRVLRSSALPRWTGWTGTIGSVAWMTGGLWLVGEPFFILWMTGNLGVLFGFVLPASIALLRLRQVSEEVGVRQDAA